MDSPKALKKVLFTSDGCSGIPDGTYRECCVMHDFYYVYRGKYSWQAFSETEELLERSYAISRKDADRLLRRCVERNEDKLWASFVYLAVRAFGWIWWYDVPQKFKAHKRMLFDLLVLVISLSVFYFILKVS